MIAAFVVVGLHLPNYVDAMRDHSATVEYLSSPTAFWLAKFAGMLLMTATVVADRQAAVAGRRRPAQA